MPIQDWAQYSLSITFVLLMLAATLWWLSRRKNGFLPKNETRRIQILETNTLGLKNKLLLVQVDRQLLLLAINSNEIQKLHAWSMDSDVSATQEFPDVI
jgi:flagellar biogenesis protein FliO